VFDFGVNAGPGRAAKYLQTQIGTIADGGIGPNTLAKLDEYLKGISVEDTIKKYQDTRLDYYKQLSTFETFGKGWTRRVIETTQMALKMI
jgi:lysozyme family protein